MRPLLLFAPGAGAPSSSGWMTAWARRLGALGDVVPFDYPYQRAGRRSPDRLPALIAAHETALLETLAGAQRPVVLVGKSMGSRVGCHLAAALAGRAEAPRALVCFGYPLRGASGALRDQALVALPTPVLFVQGARDPLCPLDELAAVRSRMSAPSALHVVEGGDHSLAVGVRALKESGRTQETCDAAALEAVRAFLTAQGL